MLYAEVDINRDNKRLPRSSNLGIVFFFFFLHSKLTLDFAETKPVLTKILLKNPQKT